MTAVMQGVRVLEVAEQTFVPAASALLSDWGAEVIKIEHPQRGDAMRGLASSGTAMIPTDVHPLLEHSNRGKLSLGLDLSSPDGLDVLYRLAATADVFLTNKLQGVRRKLRIDVDDIRAHNPKIVYVRGSGQGERGPDADKGSYDVLSFWNRSGVAKGIMRADADEVPPPPGPGFGDSIGGVTIACGIAAALFHRERTGEAPVVDVSLLSSGMWAQGQAIALATHLGQGSSGMLAAPGRNPLVANYRTKDDHWIALVCLQAGKYWAPLCECVGRPDLATNPRFASHDLLRENTTEAAAALTEIFAGRAVDEWRAVLEPFIGQWGVVQDSYEVSVDRQTVANGYIQPCETVDGTPFQLVTAPVQFDEVPATPGRAPAFNEHGDAILAELGLDWDTVVDLKVRGVVA
jgi:crotonobetainyl-CoA:carnitine CoA-transferase CaiB-like acyl-CoA transferase